MRHWPAACRHAAVRHCRPVRPIRAAVRRPAPPPDRRRRTTCSPDSPASRRRSCATGPAAGQLGGRALDIGHAALHIACGGLDLGEPATAAAELPGQTRHHVLQLRQRRIQIADALQLVGQLVDGVPELAPDDAGLVVDRGLVRHRPAGQPAGGLYGPDAGIAISARLTRSSASRPAGLRRLWSAVTTTAVGRIWLAGKCRSAAGVPAIRFRARRGRVDLVPADTHSGQRQGQQRDQPDRSHQHRTGPARHCRPHPPPPPDRVGRARLRRNPRRVARSNSAGVSVSEANMTTRVPTAVGIPGAAQHADLGEPRARQRSGDGQAEPTMTGPTPRRANAESRGVPVGGPRGSDRSGRCRNRFPRRASARQQGHRRTAIPR